MCTNWTRFRRGPCSMVRLHGWTGYGHAWESLQWIYRYINLYSWIDMIDWLVVEPYPSEKSWSSSHLGWWNSQYMEKNKNLWNHQPVDDHPPIWEQQEQHSIFVQGICAMNHFGEWNIPSWRVVNLGPNFTHWGGWKGGTVHICPLPG